MNEKASGAARGGIGFCGILTVLFIALKLLGKIDWGWPCVLSPLWAPTAIILLILLLIVVIAFLKAFIMVYNIKLYKKFRIKQKTS